MDLKKEFVRAASICKISTGDLYNGMKKVNMINYNFIQIKEKVLEWGKNFLLNDVDFIEMVKNEKDALIFDLTFQNCLAQIVVNEVFFAPYKSVSFEAMTIDSKKAIESGQPDLIYFFYDSDDTLVEEALKNLLMPSGRSAA